MPSSVVALTADKPLTPAMISTVWEISAALDQARVPTVVTDAVWIKIPTARLRGEDGRSDNVWLRLCLDQIMGAKLKGEDRGNPWGAVVLAEWHIEEGGAMARLLITPAGVHALRSPQTFTKIEARAAHTLTGHGRRLYAILSDKKRLGRPYWVFQLDELRALMGVADKSAYKVWAQFSKRVLDPALKAVNDYGTVEVRMTPERLGRSVNAIRFDWKWKDIHDAADTVAENDRHSEARRKKQTTDDAPPLIGPPAPSDDGKPVQGSPEWREKMGLPPLRK